MKGYTLIELLVVVIMLGIAVAIALPICLLFVNRAKSAEASGNLRAANSAQLLYFLRYETFAPDADTLEAGIPSESTNFIYRVTGNDQVGDTEAQPKGALIVGYRGCVFAATSTGNGTIVSGGLGQSPSPCRP